MRTWESNFDRDIIFPKLFNHELIKKSTWSGFKLFEICKLLIRFSTISPPTKCCLLDNVMYKILSDGCLVLEAIVIRIRIFPVIMRYSSCISGFYTFFYKNAKTERRIWIFLILPFCLKPKNVLNLFSQFFFIWDANDVEVRRVKVCKKDIVSTHLLKKDWR